MQKFIFARRVMLLYTYGDDMPLLPQWIKNTGKLGFTDVFLVRYNGPLEDFLFLYGFYLRLWGY